MSGVAGAARRIVPVVAASAIGVILLLALGGWQVERLRWKTDLIERIEARRTAAPRPLPPEGDWSALRPDEIDYRHVAVAGTYEADRTVLVYRGVGPNAAGEGPGFLFLTPLRLPDGARVIVNRGFAPQAQADDIRAVAPTGEVTVTGLLRPPEGRNAFTPADDPAHRRWYTRDPLAIAQAEHLDRVAPFTIDADPNPTAPAWPRAGATQLDIPNNHLSYALTWFGLAIALVGVTVAYVRTLLRQ